MERPGAPQDLAALEVQRQDVAEVVDEEVRPLDGHGRHGDAQRVGLPLIQLDRRHAGLDRVGDAEPPGRVDLAGQVRPGQVRSRGGTRVPGRRRRGAVLVLAEQAAERQGGRLGPTRDGHLLVAVAIRQLGADLLELAATPRPRQCHGGLHRQERGRKVGVGPLAQHREPAVGRAIEPPELEVQVAQPVGRVVADRGDEVRRVDSLEVLQFGGALGLVEQLLRLGVVEEPAGRLPGRGQGREDRPPAPRDRDDEAVLAVDEPCRLVVGDRVERLERPLPGAPPLESLEVVERLLGLGRGRRHLERTGRVVVGDLVGLVVLGLTEGQRAGTSSKIAIAGRITVILPLRRFPSCDAGRSRPPAIAGQRYVERDGPPEVRRRSRPGAARIDMRHL